MYISLETVCIFRLGSSVGSSGIQRLTIQEMYVSLEAICIFRLGSEWDPAGSRFYDSSFVSCHRNPWSLTKLGLRNTSSILLACVAQTLCERMFLLLRVLLENPRHD